MSTVKIVLENIDRFETANKLRGFTDVKQIEKKAILMPASKLKTYDMIVGEPSDSSPISGYEPMLVEDVEFITKNEVMVNGWHMNLDNPGRRHKSSESVWVLRTIGNVLRDL